MPRADCRRGGSGGRRGRSGGVGGLGRTLHANGRRRPAGWHLARHHRRRSFVRRRGGIGGRSFHPADPGKHPMPDRGRGDAGRCLGAGPVSARARPRGVAPRRRARRDGVVAGRGAAPGRADGRRTAAGRASDGRRAGAPAAGRHHGPVRFGPRAAAGPGVRGSDRGDRLAALGRAVERAAGAGRTHRHARGLGAGARAAGGAAVRADGGGRRRRAPRPRPFPPRRRDGAATHGRRPRCRCAIPSISRA